MSFAQETLLTVKRGRRRFSGSSSTTRAVNWPGPSSRFAEPFETLAPRHSHAFPADSGSRSSHCLTHSFGVDELISLENRAGVNTSNMRTRVRVVLLEPGEPGWRSTLARSSRWGAEEQML